jgi:hypothetical protein
MDPFFKYVAIGALVLLILILTVIGVVMNQVQSKMPFPPTQHTCPDYWDVSSNPQYCGVPIRQDKNRGYILLHAVNGVTKIKEDEKINVGLCKGTGSFGCVNATETPHLKPVEPVSSNSSYQYIQLNNNATGWGSLYPGSSERCAQKQWASLLNVTWDGVTNFTGC